MAAQGLEQVLDPFIAPQDAEEEEQRAVGRQAEVRAGGVPGGDRRGDVAAVRHDPDRKIRRQPELLPQAVPVPVAEHRERADAAGRERRPEHLALHDLVALLEHGAGVRAEREIGGPGEHDHRRQPAAAPPEKQRRGHELHIEHRDAVERRPAAQTDRGRGDRRAVPIITPIVVLERRAADRRVEPVEREAAVSDLDGDRVNRGGVGRYRVGSRRFVHRVTSWPRSPIAWHSLLV